MSYSGNSQNSSGKQQGAPIPIATGSSEQQQQQSNSGSRQNVIGSLAGSQLACSGIEAPPNSLANPSMLSTHLGQNFTSSTGQMLGGWNPPPNTPAQTNKLQQMMDAASAGSGQQQQNPGYGVGQVPTGSFIDRKIHGMGRVKESDEDEMDVDFGPDDSNPSSFRQDDRHMPSSSSKDDSDTIFEME